MSKAAFNKIALGLTEANSLASGMVTFGAGDNYEGVMHAPEGWIARMDREDGAKVEGRRVPFRKGDRLSVRPAEMAL